MKKLCCCLVLVGLLLPGCGKKQEELPTIKLLAMEYSTHTGPYWSDVAKAFNQQREDVVVEVDTVAWDQGERKIWNAIEEKEPYDLVNVAGSWLAKLVARDKVEPLETYFAPGFKVRFFPATLEANSCNGHTYGLPLTASARMLYYRLDLLEKLAPEGEKAPDIRTWQDLETVAAQLMAQVKAELAASEDTATEPLDKLCPFGQCWGGADGHLLFASFLYAAGGRFLDEDGRCVLDSREAEQALDFLVSMRKEGLSTPDADELQTSAVEKLFQDGRAGMMVSGTWLANALRREAPAIKFDILPIPARIEVGGTSEATGAAPPAGAASLVSTDALVMLKSCAHKMLAWRFIQYVYLVEQRRAFLAKELTLPVLVELAQEVEKVYQDPALKRRLYRGEMRWKPQTLGMLVKMAKTLPRARALPLHPKGAEVFAELGPYLQRAYRGELSPKQALKEVTRKVNSEVLAEE